MSKPGAFTATFIAFLVIMSCKADDKKTTDAELKTPAEKFSYAMGMDVARALKKLESEIDLDAFLKGARDGFNGSDALLTPQEVMQVKKETAAKIKEKQKIRIRNKIF